MVQCFQLLQKLVVTLDRCERPEVKEYQRRCEEAVVDILLKGAPPPVGAGWPAAGLPAACRRRMQCGRGGPVYRLRCLGCHAAARKRPAVFPSVAGASTVQRAAHHMVLLLPQLACPYHEFHCPLPPNRCAV